MESQNLLPWVATSCSISFYFSLIIPFISLLKCRKRFEDSPIQLVSTIYVESLTWYFYSGKISNEPLRYCHLAGIIICLLLIFIYLQFEMRTYLYDAILNALILIIGSLLIQKVLQEIIYDNNTIEIICVITKMICYYIPLSDLIRLIIDKNYLNINILILCTWLLSCFGWSIVNGYKKKIGFTFANSFGIIIILIHIIIYYNYKLVFRRTEKNQTVFGNESEEKNKMDINTPIEESMVKGKERPVKIISQIIK